MINTNRIRELRKRSGLTQSQLGKELHISQGMISGYESGDNSMTDEIIKQMADFFNVSTDYLLGYDVDGHTQPQDAEQHEPMTDWNVQYPAGVALHVKQQPQSNLSLSEADIARIAEKVAQMNIDAKTSPILNSSEQQLIEEYRMLSTAQRIRVQRLISVLLDNKFNEE